MSSFWLGKRVVVTGGAGFIGSHVIPKLIESEAQVVVIDNLERGRREYLEPVWDIISFHQVDLRELNAFAHLLKGTDCVIHLAAKVGGIGYYLEHPYEVLSQNLIIDQNVIQSSLRERIRYFFYASSAHIYPIELQQAPSPSGIKENQAYPANPGLTYGWEKLTGEKLLLSAVQEGCDTRIAIARIIGAFGENQDIDLETGSAIPAFCRRVIEFPRRKPFAIWGTGKETRSYCYVGDIVDGVLRSIEKLENKSILGPFNLGSEEQVSIEALAKMIVKISGENIEIKKNRRRSTLIWGQALDCSMARDLLDGWKPQTTLLQGLRLSYQDVAKCLGKMEEKNVS